VLDALGAPQSVLVLGATSDIGAATVARLADGGRLRRVVLAGRPGPALDAAVAAQRSALGEDVVVEAVAFDATEVAAHESTLGPVFDAGDVDVVVLAVGVLPETPTVPDPVEAARVVTTNFTGAVSALTVVADRCRRQGHGTLVVLSSVAGERPRRSNYLYGSTKAGLDAFATGLGEDLRGSGVVVLVVRPGFVRSSMTRGLPEAPLAVDPDDVAAAVVAHLRGPSRTLWVPGAMRPVMSVLRHLPSAVFRRLPI
jgi:decaprenylphospho-beta-D-erythro-pentofuranosid-2-ulose 2-reductase